MKTTLPTEEQIWGKTKCWLDRDGDLVDETDSEGYFDKDVTIGEGALKVIEKYGIRAAPTDLAILQGVNVSEDGWWTKVNFGLVRTVCLRFLLILKRNIMAI